ncbi:MAG: hypothetical protein K5982_04905 [Selenomonadaceae bacterium]|nr:hypothetical protein [Selenomonadaceae bacterium]
MDKRGFGMVGILAALFFVSLFAAVAMPRLWNAGAAMRLDAEAARLAAELMHYRELVMTRQPVHSDFIGVAAEGNPIVLLHADGYEMQRGRETLMQYRFPKGIALSYSGGGDVNLAYQGDVIFQLTGNATPMTIILQEGKEKRYVIIDRVGRVRVSLSPPKD